MPDLVREIGPFGVSGLSVLARDIVRIGCRPSRQAKDLKILDVESRLYQAQRGYPGRSKPSTWVTAPR